MASKDFKSNQIRTTKLIASGALQGGGSHSGNNIGIAIYSASNAQDVAGGIKDTKAFDQVGSDVMMVVSGNIGGTDASTGFGPSGNEPGGITLFTGDVYVSGNLGVGGSGGGSALQLYKENGTPAIPPVASGTPSTAIGDSNSATGNYSAIAGGFKNLAATSLVFIGGGTENTGSASYSTVVGGTYNKAGAGWSAILGGSTNQIAPPAGWAGIVSGKENILSASASGIVAGLKNKISNYAGSAFIGAGNQNFISGTNPGQAESSAITAGNENFIGRNTESGTGPSLEEYGVKYSFIGAGLKNTGSAQNTTICGGEENKITQAYGSIVGGIKNEILGSGSIGGTGQGVWKTVFHVASGSFIGGGTRNKITGSIKGIPNDSSLAVNSSIVGGERNAISGSSFSFIGGGSRNEIKCYYDGPASLTNIAGLYNTIAGGRENIIGKNPSSNDNATRYNFIGGGWTNEINTAKNQFNTFVGGYGNKANAEGLNYSSILGGRENSFDNMSTIIENSSIIGSYNTSKFSNQIHAGLFLTGSQSFTGLHVLIGNGNEDYVNNTQITMSGSVKFDTHTNKGWIQSIPFLGNATHVSNKNLLVPYGLGDASVTCRNQLVNGDYCDQFVAPADGFVIEAAIRSTNEDNTASNFLNVGIVKHTNSHPNLQGGSEQALYNGQLYHPKDTTVISNSTTSTGWTATPTNFAISKGEIIGVYVQRAAGAVAPGKMNVNVMFQWNYS